MTRPGTILLPAAEVEIPLAGLELTLSTVLWAVVGVVVTLIAGRTAYRLVLRIGHNVEGIADDLALQAARVARYLVYILGAGVVLAILGAPVQPVLAATLLVLAVVYLAVRGIADNFGAGLIIQARHPVRLGDLIESNGYRGHVKDLNARSVVLVTLDGTTVHLPNHAVMDNPLVNYSDRQQNRSQLLVRIKRSDLPNGPVHDQLAGVSDTILTQLRSVRGVLDSPAPSIRLTSTDHQELAVRVRVWHRPDAHSRVSSETADIIATAFEQRSQTVAVSWPPDTTTISIAGDL